MAMILDHLNQMKQDGLTILFGQLEKLVNKFGLYMQHIQNIIADTTKELHAAKLQGKFNKLIESKVILQAAFLLDILAEAKVFSLCTQKADANIIDITDAAQSTQHHYNGLKKSSTKILSLFLSYQPWHQFCRKLRKMIQKKHEDQKLNNFTQAEDYIQNHASDNVSKIITCFDDYFVNIYE